MNRTVGRQFASLRLAPRRVVGAVVGVSLLAACGSSQPKAKDFGNEVIDAQAVSDAAKVCMRGVVDKFSVTEAEKAAGAGADLDEVAENASDGKDAAKKVMQRFEKALSDCNS